MPATDHDWSKPAAMAIPKEGYFELERGRYGPIYPRTPACYGFSIIAKVKEGREEAVRAYGKQIQDAIAGSPDVLAPLRLHYLRWVLFDVGSGLHFQYQGIFDTDFDKYTEDAISCSARPASPRCSRIWRASPRTGREPRGVHQVRPRTPVPQFPGVRRVSVRHGRRDQEGAAAQSGVLRHARPDAVIRTRRCADA